MAFERVYQHAWNVAPADNTTNARLSASEIFFHHQLLLGLLSFTDINNAAIVSPTGVWSVAGSSDSVTGAMDATDRIGSTFNFSKFVSATNGTAHTWICYKGPTSGFGPGIYMLVSYSSSSGVNYINVKICHTLPTGGSATTDPTTTDSVSFTNQQMNDGSATAFYFDGVLSTIGDHFMFAAKSGSGQAQYHHFLPMFAQAKAGDQFPYGLYMEYQASNQGAPGNNGFFQTANWRSRYTDNSGSDGTSASSFGPYEPYNLSVGDRKSVV
jgi:hypothetical protein